MTAFRSPFQPILPIRMYSGMTPSCIGIDRLAITSSSSALRPRKCIFAKAKPASDENTSTEIDTSADTIAVLTSAFAKLAESLSNTARRFSVRCPPGVSGGGTSAMMSLVLEATTNVQ